MTVTKPKEGDRVEVSPETWIDYGYDFDPFLGPETTYTGTVVSLNYDYTRHQPDAVINIDGGGQEMVDFPFIRVIPSTPQPKQRQQRTGKMTPQVRRIRNHLRKGYTITQRSALLDFGIMALPRRIADLKEHGFPITTTMEVNDATGQRFAMYRMTPFLSKASQLTVGQTYKMVNVGHHPFAEGAVEDAHGYLTVRSISEQGFSCDMAGFSQVCSMWNAPTGLFKFDLEPVQMDHAA